MLSSWHSASQAMVVVMITFYYTWGARSVHITESSVIIDFLRDAQGNRRATMENNEFTVFCVSLYVYISQIWIDFKTHGDFTVNFQDNQTQALYLLGANLIVGSNKKQQIREAICKNGRVQLAFLKLSLMALISRYPLILLELLQLIWRPGTRRFNFQSSNELQW